MRYGLTQPYNNYEERNSLPQAENYRSRQTLDIYEIKTEVHLKVSIYITTSLDGWSDNEVKIIEGI